MLNFCFFFSHFPAFLPMHGLLLSKYFKENEERWNVLLVYYNDNQSIAQL